MLLSSILSSVTRKDMNIVFLVALVVEQNVQESKRTNLECLIEADDVRVAYTCHDSGFPMKVHLGILLLDFARIHDFDGNLPNRKNTM